MAARANVGLGLCAIIASLTTGLRSAARADDGPPRPPGAPSPVSPPEPPAPAPPPAPGTAPAAGALPTPSSPPQTGFDFGSYGRVGVGMDVRGHSGYSTNVVSHGSR